jgi:hypothetical protein
MYHWIYIYLFRISTFKLAPNVKLYIASSFLYLGYATISYMYTIQVVRDANMWNMYNKQVVRDANMWFMYNSRIVRDANR